jgi:hypothetical protein
LGSHLYVQAVLEVPCCGTLKAHRAIFFARRRAKTQFPFVLMPLLLLLLLLLFSPLQLPAPASAVPASPAPFGGHQSCPKRWLR